MVGLDYLKKNKTVMICKTCGHKCLPWQTGTNYETHTNKCTECKGEDIYSIEDENLALEIWNKTIK